MNEFNQLVATMFKLKPEEIRDEMTSKDIPHWDSMNYLLFISELEKKYSISLSMDEVLGVQSIGDLKSILTSKGIAL